MVEEVGEEVAKEERRRWRGGRWKRGKVCGGGGGRGDRQAGE
jgi:hypothetical protein